jgi:uracil-DNA glycosylase
MTYLPEFKENLISADNTCHARGITPNSNAYRRPEGRCRFFPIPDLVALLSNTMARKRREVQTDSKLIRRFIEIEGQFQ